MPSGPNLGRAVGAAAVLVAMSLCIPACRAQAPADADNSEQRAISLTEVGTRADGKTRYTLQAYSADLRDLLTVLLRRSGEEFAIAQDVTGPISLLVRDATLDEILAQVRTVARPAIVVSHGRGYTVTLAPQAAEAGQGQPTVVGGGLRRIDIGAGLGGAALRLAPSGAMNLPVTLEIPDNKPVPVVDALRSIERQTNVSIRLDNRIPRSLELAAQFTRTPLLLVLDSISRTGALKWVPQPDGSILIAPTDWLRVAVGENVVGGAPWAACSRCGLPLAPGWSFCPRCGQPVPHKAPAVRAAPEPGTPPSKG